jgi:hypothetical protein
MNKFLLLIFFPAVYLLLPVKAVYGQSLAISGTIYATDGDDIEPLGGANIQVLAAPDSSFVGGAASSPDGAFRVINLSPGTYLIRTSFLGFEQQTKSITLEEEDLTELEIRLGTSSIELEEFRITARRPRVEVRGDTTAYHADGYRTNPDANVQDLVTRMPGFVIEDGRLQAQGENVASVLLDGDEFFGDDAVMVLQNLPAEIVAQIEVFDRESDQARFTGFRDGNTDRTINIVTRGGMNTGQFGRINSGYGSQTRYMAGGNYNYFRGAQRISVIGMTNNVNQQNFSSEDMLGVSEATGSGGGRGGNATRNFRTGNQNGINSVHSTGINYNDRWNDNWRINASYFFNLTDNVHNLNRERLYLTGFSADQRYDENAFNSSDNYNHRFDMRLEHNFDDRRSFIFTSRVSVQRNSSAQNVDAFTLDQNSQFVNNIIRENRNSMAAYNVNSNLLYRQRFETRGRTFSANLRTNISDRNGERYQFDDSQYFDDGENRIINDQQTETFNGGYSLNGNFSYTEPVTERTQLMFSYQPSVNNNESVQDVFRFDETTNSYSRIDTSLTNRYDNRVYSNRLRSSYRFSNERINANMSLSWQHTLLDGEQSFPYAADISQTWQNFLPGASLQYNFNRRSNIRFNYNTGTRTPSVRQLQDVIDNSDPLRLTTGNPELNQQYDHRFSIRLRHAKPEAGTSTSGFISFNITQNHIGNRTFVAQEDTELAEGVILGRGSRLVSPDNIGSSYNFFSRLNRSLPVDFISSNLSLNAGVGFNRRPSFIDDARNLTDNYRLNSGLQISSNISKRVDFRVAYYANYNIVENSIRPELDNNYYAGRANGVFNLMPFKGFVIASDVNLRHYAGLGDDFNQGNIFWNGSIGYKFLENDSAEFRITVFDILGQNDNINRNIQEDFIEDYRSNVLTRYMLFSFNYRFRSFGRG